MSEIGQNRAAQGKDEAALNKRRPWVAPVWTKIAAGSAENAAGPRGDNRFSQS